MATLYELTDDYLTLLEMAEDPDIDEQALKDTMEGIEGALEIKAEGYAKIIRMLEGDAEACDAESKRLRNKKQTIENNIKRMKGALQMAMEATGKRKFKTPLFSFNIQKNPAAVHSIIHDLLSRNIRHLRFRKAVGRYFFQNIPV